MCVFRVHHFIADKLSRSWILPAREGGQQECEHYRSGTILNLFLFIFFCIFFYFCLHYFSAKIIAKIGSCALIVSKLSHPVTSKEKDKIAEEDRCQKGSGLRPNGGSA